MKTTRTPIKKHVCLKNLSRGLAVITLVILTSKIHAADVFRADNANTLDNPAAWAGGATPTSTDVAVWDSTVVLNTNSTIGVDTNWAGIRIANPGGLITLAVGNTLTLGASGIDMSAATTNLVLNNTTSISTNQTWNIAANRTITAGGNIVDNADGFGRTWNINGPGTLNLNVTTIFNAGTVTNILLSGGATLNANAGLANSAGTITLSNGIYALTTTAGTLAMNVADNTTNTYNSVNSTADSGVWSGGGTLILVANASGRIATFNGSMTAYNGTVRWASGTGLGQFRANNAANVGSTNVTFDLGNNASGTLNKNAGAGTFFIGQLFGGASTFVSSGVAGEIFDIGYKGDSLFNGAITGGSASLNKSGPTTLILAGASTYGGGTTISNGVLQIGNGGTAGTLNPASIVTNYSILAINRSDVFTFTNVITGSGNVSNIGVGTLLLKGVNTHTGKTIVAAGTLLIPVQTALGANPGSFTADHLILNGGAIGATNNSGLTDVNRGLTLGANGGGLAPSSGMTLTISNVISGAGNLTVSNSGTVVLTAANAYTGKTILNSGVLAIGAETAIGGNPGSPTADQLTFNGGTLSNTVALTIDDANRGVTLGVSGGTLNTSGGTLTIADVIAGSSGALTKAGSGILSLTSANTYSGNTLINSGTLALGASGSIANSALISVASGATYDVSAVSGYSLSSGQTLGGNGTVSGNVSAGTGSTVSAGSSIGQLNITGNVTFSGGTNLVEINSSTNDVVAITGNLTLTGTSTIQLNVQSGLTSGRRVLMRYTGSLSGAGSFALSGAPGGTTVDTSVAHEVAIVLNIVAANLTWKGDGSVNAWDGITANWSNGVTTVLFNSGDNVTFNDTGSQSPAVNITAAQSPNSVTVNATGNYIFSGAGKITGLTGLTKSNTGTLTLLTANDYSGSALLSQGLVQVGNGSTAGSLGTGTTTNNTTLVFNLPSSGGTQSGNLTGTGTLTVQAGSLTLSGNGSYSGTTTNASGATLKVGAGGGSGSVGSGAVQNDGSLIFNRTGTLIHTAPINGTGTLTNQGSGTVALAGNNSYSGATTISAGTLQIGAGGTSGTLGTATTVTDNGTLAFSRSDNITNSVVITGTGSLVQQGPGTLTVVSTNTYSGGTIINGGSLQLGDGVSSATLGTGNVTDNGALIVNRPDNFFLTNVISGSGTLVKIGTNTLRFNNTLATANTFSGGTIISNGTIRLGPDAGGDTGTANAKSLGSGPVTFYGGTLRLYDFASQLSVPTAFTTPIIVPAGQSGTVLAGQNGGNFASTVTGSGTLAIVLNPPTATRNNIGGDWSAFAGQMIVAGDTAVRISVNNFANSGIMVSNITTLGTIAGNNTIISIGELTGTGTVGPVDQGSTGPTWVIGSKNTAATFDGVIADQGVTSVRKVGTNVWTLTGVQTYTGNTTISNGVLALATNSLGADADISGSAKIIVVSPGILDATRLTTTPGSFPVNSTLGGNGTVKGSVAVNGTLQPDISGTNISNLTITSNLVVNGTVTMYIDHSGSVTSDEVTCTNITVTGGTLNVTEISTNDLHTGDTFQLFSTPILGAGFSTVNITPTTTLDATITYGWDLSKLAVNGTIVLTNGAPTVNTNPTNITATVSGNVLTLSWPADHLGWHLQIQTNSLSVGINTNWVTLTGSDAVTSTNLTINPANGTVFYRMVYP